MTYRETPYQQTGARLAAYRREITALRDKMRALQQTVEPEEVADYLLTGADGPIRLSALFGGKDTLFVIHNMGTTCRYCTLWADGFNGIYHHLASRAAFVVSARIARMRRRNLPRAAAGGFPW